MATPHEDFLAASIRFREATAAATTRPTSAEVIDTYNAAIEDYNRAVDAYNAAHEPNDPVTAAGAAEAANRLTAICEYVETYGVWPRTRAAKRDATDLRTTLSRWRKLEAEQLNPAEETLDADAYRYLRDQIAATMTDDWDGDEAESWILAQYVKWLAAGQPRDEDGYPVRRESYPAAERQQSDRDALAARVAELERALADVDMRFRLSHGGGWCAACRLPMREGTPVVKTLAVVCEPCAADLAATAGRLDPSRLAARKDAELAARDGQDAEAPWADDPDSIDHAIRDGLEWDGDQEAGF